MSRDTIRGLMQSIEAQKAVFEHLSMDPDFTEPESLAETLKKMANVVKDDVDMLMIAKAALADMFNAHIDREKLTDTARCILGAEDVAKNTAGASNLNRARLDMEVADAKAKPEVQTTLAYYTTGKFKKSEVMRRLAGEGISRGAIAKILGVRYQFVYQVLGRDTTQTSA